MWSFHELGYVTNAPGGVSLFLGLAPLACIVEHSTGSVATSSLRGLAERNTTAAFS